MALLLNRDRYFLGFLTVAAIWQQCFATVQPAMAIPLPIIYNSRFPVVDFIPVYYRSRLLRHQRHLQPSNNATATANSNCTGDPFLWLIQKEKQPDGGNNSISTNSTTMMETVGFAMGTMHVPRELALSSDAAFMSLLHALKDACTVYAELDFNNPAVIDELTQCTTNMNAAAVNNKNFPTVMDIPDPDMQQRYFDILLTIAQEYASSLGPADLVAQSLADSIPLGDILNIIEAYNTPESKDSTLAGIFNGEATPIEDVSFLDTELLDEGRSTASLETVQTQCNLLAQLQTATSTSRDDFLVHYETQYAATLEAALEYPSVLSHLFQAYRCGNVDRVLELIEADESLDLAGEDFMKAFIDDRNIQMANRVVDILETTTTIPMFAVGLAHWIQGGDNSMEALLNQQGYSLKRVVGQYDSTLLPDWTDAQCDETHTVAGAEPTSNNASSASTFGLHTRLLMTLLATVATGLVGALLW